MSGAQSISTRRAYGVQRVCRVWHRARSSVYARRQATRSPALCRRRGPIGAAPDDVLVAHIRRVLEASPFHGEGYRKAWAKLRVAGMRTSKERVRRLMREHDLQAPPRAGHAHGPKAHDGTITTEAPDVMWGTDMTATVTVAEGAAFVFVAVDHCATACIGLHAAKRGNRFEALEPIRQGIRERFGGIGDGVARGLRLRHDHGSNYLADDFQQEVAFFGIESSPSFVREPEGNGVAERFIRTLKENRVVGAELRDDRGAPPGLARVQADVQRAVDAGEVRLPKPGPGATRPPRAGRGGVEANTVKPLSKNPGAVQRIMMFKSRLAQWKRWNPASAIGQRLLASCAASCANRLTPHLHGWTSWVGLDRKDGARLRLKRYTTSTTPLRNGLTSRNRHTRQSQPAT